MSSNNNLSRAFAHLSSNSHAALYEIDQMARQIPFKTREVKAPPLHPSTARILKKAPSFFSGFYDISGIVDEIAREDNVSLTSRTRVTRIGAVRQVIALLRKRKLLPEPTKRNFQMRVLRQATDSKIRQNLGLVHAVLARGHRYLRRDWRDHLKYRDAVAAGTLGLKRAIEAHDGRRAFSSYAFHRIAAAVSDQIRQMESQRRREVSLDLTPRRQLRSEPSQRPSREAEFDVEYLERLFASKAKPHHVGVFVLMRGYGFTLQELADHFHVSRQAVSLVSIAARKNLEKHVE